MNKQSVGKQFARYVSLNVLGTMGTSFYILADTLFISAAAGADGITALNLVLPVYSFIYAVGTMLGVGSAIRFSILRAQGNEDADSYFFRAVMWAFVLGAFFMLAGGFAPEKVMEIMGGDAGIVAVGRSYTRTFMLFAPFFMLNFIVSAFVRNDGDPSLAMAAVLTSSISNVFLDYLFMFPLGMGMMGAALATGLSPVIGTSVCSLHFLSRKNTLVFRPSRLSIGKLYEVCRLGIAGFVGEISSGVTTAVFNFVILGLAGNVGVAAYGVVANVSLVANAIFNGISNGSQPLVSSYYGEKEEKHLKQVLHLGIGTAFALAVLVLVIINLSAVRLTALFNSGHSASLAAYAHIGLRLYFTGFLFAGFNITGIGYLGATAQSEWAFAASLMRGFVAIVAFAFLLPAFLGMTGIWLAFPAAELVTACVTITGLRRKSASGSSSGGRMNLG